ncbi:MAG: cation:proton antiporter [Archaeoglobaceae archaeon]|nr:cation:proton antiporter [Archaeoglobaceae archaeon]MCX8152149.1 cation:proton antiporter [Archaeoglobaceae archaeon]MDW8013865.1 cation:proton antiporter [Archaeoglobaceae archaeon]
MEVFLAITICALLAYLVKTFSLPSIPLYIVLGLILGNSGLKILKSSEVSDVFSELGAVLLAFYIGMQLNFSTLKKVENFYSGIADLILNFLPILFLTAFLGFELKDALVLSLAIYTSSTIMVFRSLVENKKLALPESETIVWIMVFEDLVILILLPVVFAFHVEIYGIFIVIFSTFLIYNFSEKLKVVKLGEDVAALVSLSIPAFAVVISKVFDFPSVLSAIFFGFACSKVKEIEKAILPFKEVFLSLFFLFFAAKISFSVFPDVKVFLIILILAVILKILAGILAGLIVHRSFNSGIEIGATIVPRGEFSILLAMFLGNETVSAVITLLVLVSSILGSFTAKYSYKLKSISV